MLNLHNVWMAQEPKKLDFTEDAGGIRDMFKYIVDLFDSDFFTHVCIVRRANNTIATFTNDFLYFIPAPFTIFREKIYICR